MAGNIDLDNFDAQVVLLDQEEEHVEIRNYPCNCKDCIMWALIFGVAKVEANGNVWVPVMTDDDMVHILTAADMRKTFSAHKTPEEIASAMSEMRVRAFRKEPPSARVSTGKKAAPKRKANDDLNPNDPKDLFPISGGGGAASSAGLRTP
jgi:hypothetical protein